MAVLLLKGTQLPTVSSVNRQRVVHFAPLPREKKDSIDDYQTDQKTKLGINPTI